MWFWNGTKLKFPNPNSLSPPLFKRPNSLCLLFLKKKKTSLLVLFIKIKSYIVIVEKSYVFVPLFTFVLFKIQGVLAFWGWASTGLKKVTHWQNNFPGTLDRSKENPQRLWEAESFAKDPFAICHLLVATSTSWNGRTSSQISPLILQPKKKKFDKLN